MDSVYTCLHTIGSARRLLRISICGDRDPSLLLLLLQQLELDEGSPPRQISHASVFVNTPGHTTCPMRLSERWMIWMRMPPRTSSQIIRRSSGESFDSSELCSWTSQLSLESACFCGRDWLWLRVETTLCLRERGRAAGLLSGLDD